MNSEAIETIIAAILAKKPIQFDYVKEGKIQGIRIGNPHIIFAGETREKIPRVWVHLVQTSGASDTQEEFPNWRTFISDFIKDVKVLSDLPEFEISDGYNPDASMYVGTKILARV